MSAQPKVELPDEIYVQQANLQASILVLPHHGVEMLQLEMAIHVLLSPLSQKALRACFAGDLLRRSENLLAAADCNGEVHQGCAADLVEQLITKFCADHAARYMLAFVYSHL